MAGRESPAARRPARTVTWSFVWIIVLGKRYVLPGKRVKASLNLAADQFELGSGRILEEGRRVRFHRVTRFEVDGADLSEQCNQLVHPLVLDAKRDPRIVITMQWIFDETEEAAGLGWVLRFEVFDRVVPIEFRVPLAVGIDVGVAFFGQPDLGHELVVK